VQIADTNKPKNNNFISSLTSTSCKNSLSYNTPNTSGEPRKDASVQTDFDYKEKIKNLEDEIKSLSQEIERLNKLVQKKLFTQI